MNVFQTVYLASPYSSNDPAVTMKRLLDTQIAAAKLVKRGVFVLSPFIHCHMLKVVSDLEGDFNTWRNWNLAFIHLCSEFWVLCLPGWRDSVGVTYEIDYAKAIGKVIAFVDPTTLVIGYEPIN